MRLIQCLVGIVAMGCSANGGDSSVTILDGSVTPGLRAPGMTCEFTADDGGTRSTSSLCAENPALAGCHMCLELSATGNSPSLCVYPCRVGMSDCPSGQTCLPQPGGSRSTNGSCRTFAEPSALGYCQ